MSSDLVAVLSTTEGMDTIVGAATMDKWNSGVLKSRESQVEYLRELDEGYSALNRGTVWIEGQKTIHGAYVYRNLWLLTEKGKKKIVDPIFPTDENGQARKPEPLGTLVQRHLGVSSAMSTRYGKVARLVFDAGYSPQDPDWSRLTSDLVDDPDFCADILDRGSVTTRKGIEERLAILDAPPTPAIEGGEKSDEDDKSGEDTSGESDEGASDEDKSDEGTDEGTDSQVPENGEGRTTPVASEPVGNAGRFERILAEIAALTASDDSDDVAAVYVVRDALTAYLRGFGDAVRAEGKAHYERLHKS